MFGCKLSSQMFHFLTKCNKTLIPKSYHHHLQLLSSINCNSSINQKLSDLLISCGIKPSLKPIYFVTFFKSFGFSDTQIKRIVSKVPSALSFDFSTIHKPKIDFFQTIGFSPQDVIKLVSSDPYILYRSLQNHLIPAFNLLKHYYGGEEIAIGRIKQRAGLIRCQIITCLGPNTEILRDFGVPETTVVKMVSGSYCCIICANTKPDIFRKVVAAVMNMGFDPSSASFEHAVHAKAWQSEQAWLKKLNVYKGLGFSEREIHEMFRKQPIVLGISENKIRAAVNFYFEKFNWSPLHVVKTPNSLMYSLDKRVVPRCSVLQVLVSKNKVDKVKIISILTKTEDKFLTRYVNRYKDEVPEILDAYQGKIKFDNFTFVPR